LAVEIINMKYAILDIETTGGKYNEEGITEVAIYQFDGNQITDQFISLVNPEKSIQAFVVKLTGITDKMVIGAPKFHEIAKRIIEITEDCILIAHNAQFDYRILKTEYSRLGYEYQRKTLCTVDLSKKLIPDMESYSLGKLVRALGIPVSDRHRANGDALATLKLFKLLLSKEADHQTISELTRSENTGILTNKQVDLLDQIPNETGLVSFLDKEDQVIYVLASDQLKKDITQLFTKQSSVAKSVNKKMRQVKVTLTGSLLMAQMKYQLTLTKFRPKYNRMPTKKSLHTSINMNYPFQDGLMIDKGRNEGEKSVYRIKSNQLHSLGYIELNYQINNEAILDQLLNTVKENNPLKKTLLSSHLKKPLKLHSLEVK
jgi:DNA polymerase-3 subunit epsilon